MGDITVMGFRNYGGLFFGQVILMDTEVTQAVAWVPIPVQEIRDVSDEALGKGRQAAWVAFLFGVERAGGEEAWDKMGMGNI